jgi:hypothetical protein
MSDWDVDDDLPDERIVTMYQALIHVDYRDTQNQ